MSETSNTDSIRKDVADTSKDVAVLEANFQNLQKTVDANHLAVMQGQTEIKELFKTEVFPRIRKLETRQIWFMGFAAGCGAILKYIWEWLSGTGSHH
jgi:hypothetical protein